MFILEQLCEVADKKTHLRNLCVKPATGWEVLNTESVLLLSLLLFCCCCVVKLTTGWEVLNSGTVLLLSLLLFLLLYCKTSHWMGGVK